MEYSQLIAALQNVREHARVTGKEMLMILDKESGKVLSTSFGDEYGVDPAPGWADNCRANPGQRVVVHSHPTMENLPLSGPDLLAAQSMKVHRIYAITSGGCVSWAGGMDGILAKMDIAFFPFAEMRLYAVMDSAGDTRLYNMDPFVRHLQLFAAADAKVITDFGFTLGTNRPIAGLTPDQAAVLRQSPYYFSTVQEGM